MSSTSCHLGRWWTWSGTWQAARRSAMAGSSPGPGPDSRPVSGQEDPPAPAVQHQPAQVALATGALVGAREGLEHVGGERLKAPADGGQLGRCDAPTAPSWWTRRAHPPTHHPSDANLTESC